MFKLTDPLPNRAYVACSGGVDSMAVLHWVSVKPERILGAVYVHHGTGEFADHSESIVRDYCHKHNINLLVYNIEGEVPKGRSKEDWWREQRYDFFHNKVPGTEPIILGHHLDDCLEEYLMCSLVRGYEGTIPYSNRRCIRPFRKWKKGHIRKYAKDNGLTWAEDPSNSNTNYKRNFIRHNIVPQAIALNPGLYKLVSGVIDKVDFNEYQV